MDSSTKVALIALSGVLISLIVRDVILQLYTLRKKRDFELVDQLWKRNQELESKHRDELIRAHDVVRLYSDPLLQSCVSLRYRLQEVLQQKGRAAFLLTQTPQSEFVIYKRISTLYRLAVLLGWIRAYQKERSYLDPADAGQSEIETAVQALQGALADGPHVETQRLNELLRIWVPVCPTIEASKSKELAIAVDNTLRSILTEENRKQAPELPDAAKERLCRRVARIISDSINVNIPDELLEGEKNRALAFLGIKEAYIYRDWQQAIGDTLLVPISNASRRFDVMGYDQFEALFLSQNEADIPRQRWIRRLDAVFLGLEPDKEDIFDARRNQLKRVFEATIELQRVLQNKFQQYSSQITNVDTAPNSLTSSLEANVGPRKVSQ